MAPPVKKFREIVFQFLYSREFEQSDEEEMIPLVMHHQLIPKTVAKQAAAEAGKIWSQREMLDKVLAKKVVDYEFSRITRVELAALRLGAYELLIGDLPPKVAITEALRIARKYATAEGASFINGVLDAIYKEERAPDLTPSAAE